MKLSYLSDSGYGYRTIQVNTKKKNTITINPVAFKFSLDYWFIYAKITY